MRTLIYLDESGDLGFSLDKPYQKGGSSRMLTLCAVVLPENKEILLNRIVRAIYKKRQRPLNNELKSVYLNQKDKALFLQLTAKMLQNHRDIQLYSITVSKAKVSPRFIQDPNVLYNYLTKLLLLEPICNAEYVDFMPDRRSERVNAKWNMGEYLNQMIQETSLERTIINKSCSITPMDSSKCLGLQFIDFYAGMIWAMHEYHEPTMQQFIHTHNLTDKTLFF